eukprot:TRINITY_DN18886_c0_g1_i1.p1 TRINITY_DN18886_c0_g1~~TRINITY_DN18886_c0_g1_i1.p1  ORF type:complete len:574 (-),score=90.01 TRINITY_DN18886_c0_g1_i1:14-1735(-)
MAAAKPRSHGARGAKRVQRAGSREPSRSDMQRELKSAEQMVFYLQGLASECVAVQAEVRRLESQLQASRDRRLARERSLCDEICWRESELFRLKDELRRLGEGQAEELSEHSQADYVEQVDHADEADHISQAERSNPVHQPRDGPTPILALENLTELTSKFVGSKETEEDEVCVRSEALGVGFSTALAAATRSMVHDIAVAQNEEDIFPEFADRKLSYGNWPGFEMLADAWWAAAELDAATELSRANSTIATGIGCRTAPVSIGSSEVRHGQTLDLKTPVPIRTHSTTAAVATATAFAAKIENHGTLLEKTAWGRSCSSAAREGVDRLLGEMSPERFQAKLAKVDADTRSLQAAAQERRDQTEYLHKKAIAPLHESLVAQEIMRQHLLEVQDSLVKRLERRKQRDNADASSVRQWKKAIDTARYAGEVASKKSDPWPPIFRWLEGELSAVRVTVESMRGAVAAAELTPRTQAPAKLVGPSTKCERRFKALLERASNDADSVLQGLEALAKWATSCEASVGRMVASVGHDDSNNMHENEHDQEFILGAGFRDDCSEILNMLRTRITALVDFEAE